MVRRMYTVDVYLRVRRAVMVEGMSVPGGFPGVGAAPGHGAQDTGLFGATRLPAIDPHRTDPTLRQAQDDPSSSVIDRILDDDYRVPRKRRHTAKRIFERLRDEHGFDGGYVIVKDCVREHRRRTLEMFAPLSRR